MPPWQEGPPVRHRDLRRSASAVALPPQVEEVDVQAASNGLRPARGEARGRPRHVPVVHTDPVRLAAGAEDPAEDVQQVPGQALREARVDDPGVPGDDPAQQWEPPRPTLESLAQARPRRPGARQEERDALRHRHAEPIPAFAPLALLHEGVQGENPGLRPRVLPAGPGGAPVEAHHQPKARQDRPLQVRCGNNAERTLPHRVLHHGVDDHLWRRLALRPTGGQAEPWGEVARPQPFPHWSLRHVREEEPQEGARCVLQREGTRVFCALRHCLGVDPEEAPVQAL
mmetsp:Transcript_4322/g.15170  ORF Transcript_4322/g.15170 Transcript_4322/m.15170 type:complete len:285 (-) Transcript_4322:260-1114(-)